MRFLLTGGRSRARGADADHQCDAGMVVELDTETRSVEVRFVYESPDEVRAEADASIVFKAGHVVDGRLYLCTTTEVLVTPLDDVGRVERYVSHPWFNDVHHVRPGVDPADLLVVSTGLDAVLRVDPTGDVADAWPVIDDDLWTRFDPDTDYRRVLSTKPHRSHPNHVYVDGDRVVVNRCHQRDAVTVDDRAVVIDYGALDAVGHDGVIVGEHVFFTSVNGRVAVFDRSTGTHRTTLDLDAITASDRPLGWCRGVAPIDPHRWLVGFSRMRPTRWEENVSWAKAKLRGRGGPKAPTRVACYDPTADALRWEVDLEPIGMAEIFSILPVDDRPGDRVLPGDG